MSSDFQLHFEPIFSIFPLFLFLYIISNPQVLVTFFKDSSNIFVSFLYFYNGRYSYKKYLTPYMRDRGGDPTFKLLDMLVILFIISLSMYDFFLGDV